MIPIHSLKSSQISFKTEKLIKMAFDLSFEILKTIF